MANAYTPEWWLARLNKRLDDRQPLMMLYEDYYLGKHRMTFATSKFRETFGNLFKALAVNFCGLVVDAENERLKIEGFRMGRDVGDADKEAWRIWTGNQMESRAPIAHAEALSKGESYVLVWANPNKPDLPIIRPQDAKKCIVEYDDGDADVRRAGLKRWVDAERYENATLYLPDNIYKYRSAKPLQDGIPGPTSRSETGYWVERKVKAANGSDEPWPLPNPLKVVPLVPLMNNPLLDVTGRSEIGPVIPIQDAINKLVADMIVASEYVAFPQRWATGIDVPIDEATKQPLEPFKAGPGRLWIADAVPGMDQPIEPKFGAFPQADLNPYTSAIDMLVKHIASITKTPAHYLLGATDGSGETLKMFETGLVAKTTSASRQFGEPWEEVVRLAHLVLGKTVDSVSTVWGDPESRSLAEVTDAVGKHVQMLGVPKRIGWEKVGYTQSEIERMETLAQQERLEGALSNVPTAPMDPAMAALAERPSAGNTRPQVAGGIAAARPR